MIRQSYDSCSTTVNLCMEHRFTHQVMSQGMHLHTGEINQDRAPGLLQQVTSIQEWCHQGKKTSLSHSDQESHVSRCANSKSKSIPPPPRMTKGKDNYPHPLTLPPRRPPPPLLLLPLSVWPASLMQPFFSSTRSMAVNHSHEMWRLPAVLENVEVVALLLSCSLFLFLLSDPPLHIIGTWDQGSRACARRHRLRPKPQKRCLFRQYCTAGRHRAGGMSCHFKVWKKRCHLRKEL